MKCPKCHSEVGNQPVCPYCGGTMYIQSTTWNMQNFARNAGVAGHEIYAPGRRKAESYETDKKLHAMEMKINFALILLGGMFMLILLMLIVMVLK